MLAKQVALLVLIAGGDEFFQPQLLKVITELVEEVAHPRVIAIAQYGFAPKMFAVMS